MKQSARAKRLARHHKRFNNAPKLNLVSLMDIFTILVFFLIVNQSEVRVLQTTKDINLPISVADKMPDENVLITVLNNTVLVQERPVWQQNDLTKVLNDKTTEQLIAAIKSELDYLANKRSELTKLEQEQGRAVTIIGDSSIPYKVLKQIMAACAESNYRNISLAVKQVARDKAIASQATIGE
jgi:biopolymer transport protein ExbD